MLTNVNYGDVRHINCCRRTFLRPKCVGWQNLPTQRVSTVLSTLSIQRARMAALAPKIGAFALPAQAPRSRKHAASKRIGRPASSVSSIAAAPVAIETKLSAESVPDAVSTDAPLRVLVAGGGLGGLFAAICLRNAGADVAVIERTATYRHSVGLSAGFQRREHHQGV